MECCRRLYYMVLISVWTSLSALDCIDSKTGTLTYDYYCVSDLQLSCLSHQIKVSWKPPTQSYKFVLRYELKLILNRTNTVISRHNVHPTGTEYIFCNTTSGEAYRISILVRRQKYIEGLSQEVCTSAKDTTTTDSSISPETISTATTNHIPGSETTQPTATTTPSHSIPSTVTSKPIQSTPTPDTLQNVLAIILVCTLCLATVIVGILLRILWTCRKKVKYMPHQSNGHDSDQSGLLNEGSPHYEEISDLVRQDVDSLYSNPHHLDGFTNSTEEGDTSRKEVYATSQTAVKSVA